MLPLKGTIRCKHVEDMNIIVVAMQTKVNYCKIWQKGSVATNSMQDYSPLPSKKDLQL